MSLCAPLLTWNPFQSESNTQGHFLHWYSSSTIHKCPLYKICERWMWDRSYPLCETGRRVPCLRTYTILRPREHPLLRQIDCIALHVRLDISCGIKAINLKETILGRCGEETEYWRTCKHRKHGKQNDNIYLVKNTSPSIWHKHTNLSRDLFIGNAKNCLIGLGILVLLLTNLKGLASLKRSLSSHLALLALQTEHQLLGLLSLRIN